MKRVSNRYYAVLLVRIVSLFSVAVVFHTAAYSLWELPHRTLAFIGLVVCLLLSVVYLLLYGAQWRYAINDDVVALTYGVIVRKEAAIPYARIQHISVNAGPVERLVGLAHVNIYTAGSKGAKVTVPGVPVSTARSLRSQIGSNANDEPDGDSL
ncbi:MAG: PH domain-containing protein [Halapricum sp.]